jgi:hypothetical protein
LIYSQEVTTTRQSRITSTPKVALRITYTPKVALRISCEVTLKVP